MGRLLLQCKTNDNCHAFPPSEHIFRVCGWECMSTEVPKWPTPRVFFVKLFPAASCCYDTFPDIRDARRQNPQWRAVKKDSTANRIERFPQWMIPH